MLREGKVIGCSLNVDLLQYLSMPQMPSQLDLFRKIGEAGRHLEGQLNLSSFKAGEVCYGMMGCVDPKEAGKQAATLFWLHQVTLGKLAGWKYFFSRISSPVSLRLLQKMGGEVIAETEIAGLEGEQKMWMVKIDLRKPDCSPSQMRQCSVPPGPKL